MPRCSNVGAHEVRDVFSLLIGELEAFHEFLIIWEDGMD